MEESQLEVLKDPVHDLEGRAAWSSENLAESSFPSN
jgi:hypothetical protein